MIWTRLLLRSVVIDECLVWQGYCNPASGYGQLTLSKKDQARLDLPRISTIAQVVARLTKLEGDGDIVLHNDILCKHKACWNPDHLRWGTYAENSKDSWTTGGQKWGENHHRAKYTDGQVQELRDRVNQGEKAYKVAKEIGMDMSYAYKVTKGMVRPFQPTCIQDCLDGN